MASFVRYYAIRPWEHSTTIILRKSRRSSDNPIPRIFGGAWCLSRLYEFPPIIQCTPCRFFSKPYHFMVLFIFFVVPPQEKCSSYSCDFSPPRKSSGLDDVSPFRCGHEDVEIDKHGTGICDYPCGGDTDSICGGHLAFSAYAVGEWYIMIPRRHCIRIIHETKCRRSSSSSHGWVTMSLVMFGHFKKVHIIYTLAFLCIMVLAF